MLLSAACRTPDVTSPSAPAPHVHERFEPAAPFSGQVYVVEMGRDDAPPLVLIHGLGDRGARDFVDLLPVLSGTHHVLAFDLPGFGRSSRERDVYSPERYTQFVDGLVRRHFDRPVDVLGHSMGGAIAASFAGTHPERVRRLVLLDVAGILHYRDYLRTIVRAPLPDDTTFVETMKAIRQTMFDIAWWPVSGLRLESLELASRPRPYLSTSQTAALLLVQHDFGPALRAIRAPTFLGWGRYDTIAPMRTADALRHVLGVEKVHVFERSGHVPMRREADAVAQSVAAFLAADEASVRRSEPVWTSSREARIEDARDRIVAGDFERIVIRHAKRITLRNVRTRSLEIAQSEVDLVDVTVQGADVGVVAKQSDIRWTGGTIDAATCMHVDESHLNLLALSCTGSEDGMRVRTKSTLMASASVVKVEAGQRLLHDELDLTPTTDRDIDRDPRSPLGEGVLAVGGHTSLRTSAWHGEDLSGEDLEYARLAFADLREMRLLHAKLRGAVLRGADLRETILQEADLRGADLRGADLRGARLSGADLRAANLDAARVDGAEFTGARYDATTILSDDLCPIGARLVALPRGADKSECSRLSGNAQRRSR